MTPGPLTLDQLLVLDAIERTGAFAAAARELHRVPSAISYTVKALEDALGVALFDRSGHRALLTPAGRRLLEHARHVLREAETLRAVARELHGGWEPELRVVLDGALPLGPVMAALRRLSELDAPTRVRLDVAWQEGVWDRFQHDDGDVMLLLDAEEGAAALPTRALPPLEMVLVVAEGHPLADRPVDRGELDRYVSLVVRDSARRFDRTPRETFLGTARLHYLSDFTSKRAALLAGVGFGWMPVHLVADALHAGRLRELRLAAGSRWTYQPRLVHRADRPLGRAGRLLVEALSVSSFDEDAQNNSLSRTTGGA